MPQCLSVLCWSSLVFFASLSPAVSVHVIRDTEYGCDSWLCHNGLVALDGLITFCYFIYDIKIAALVGANILLCIQH